MQHCPRCGSSETYTHENMSPQKKRYKCKNCSKSWTVTENRIASKTEISDDIKIDGRTLTSRSANITSLEALLEYSKVDLDVWAVDRHIINAWEVTTKDSGTYTNYQVKAWLKPKTEVVSVESDIESIKEDAKKHAYQYKKIDYIAKKEKNIMLEISLFDHHFGQLSWGEETGGENYDTKIAEKLAIDSIDYILSRARIDCVDKILLPIGNDFFNVNNSFNTTYAGTLQSEDDRWKKTYKKGRELWVKIIEMLMSIAPVDVPTIPGNHDTERSYYLGDSLECWFNKCDMVSIDNGPKIRKYREYGNTLLGITHGDKEIKNGLAYIMATEKPLEWGRTKYHEFQKGHFHAASNKVFQVMDEYYGFRENVLPSLVPTDDWHAGKGYSAMRETQAFEYDRELGKTVTIAWHP